MLFDGYDLYVFTNVLPAAAQSGFSTALQNADFISKTFLGMTVGALATGVLGDRYGRRFTYQINLLIFGLASLAAPFAPDMTTLIWLRFVMGLGLGAEIVVGYSTLTEFMPPKSRGRWLSFMAVLAGVVYARFTAATDIWLVLTVGFLLIVAIYIQVALLFGVYTPELFPTEVRLRANGICNTVGRAATIVSPFIVLWLPQSYAVAGVLALMVVLLAVQIIVDGAGGLSRASARSRLGFHETRAVGCLRNVRRPWAGVLRLVGFCELILGQAGESVSE
jgi:MFS family permease